MDIESSYDQWSANYDHDENKTRDLEATVLRKTLVNLTFSKCLEIGCGTGKNTIWLAEKSTQLLGVDLSSKMLEVARMKINDGHVAFTKADVNKAWNFTESSFDMITFSLVLEHIEDLDHVFLQAYEKLIPGGHLYLAELHPYKQYSGSKARFESENGTHRLTCFNHHISDYLNSARKAGFQLVNVDEHFHDQDQNKIPRILSVLFRKSIRIKDELTQ